MASVTREMGGDLLVMKDYGYSYATDINPYPGKKLRMRQFTPLDDSMLTKEVKTIMQRKDSIIEDFSYISYGLNDVFENSFVI